VVDGLMSRFPIFQTVIHPVVIFGGLFLSLVMNAPTVATAKVDRAEGNTIITFSTKGRLLNVVVIVSSILFASAVLLYAISENSIIMAK
jgi:hypothetical protein